MSIESIQAEHRYRDVLGDHEIAPYYKHIGCSCGWEQNIAGMSGWRSWLAAHEAHLADLIRDALTGDEAVEAVVDALVMDPISDSFGTDLSPVVRAARAAIAALVETIGGK